MDQNYEHEQGRPLLTGSPPPRAYSTTLNNSSTIAPNAIGYRPNYEADSDDDDEIGPPKKLPVWKAWLYAIFKFFQGLGKFFLILALGTIILVIVLQYTLPSVDELFFSKLVKRKFGDRMEKWNTQLERHRNDLMSYIILLRLAPFPPNWFINICSPHLHVPLWPEFFIGTLIGVTAPSVVHVQAGMVLEKLVEDHSSGVNIFTLKNIGMLVAVALLAALPVLIRWILARREARKVGINVDALDHEEEGTIDTNDLDPILEPLDPTGLIISPEHQHFLKRSSSFSRTEQHHPQSHSQPQQQPQQQ
ncbi:Transmembrane protein 41B [Mortierella sp. AM989]|nr:Transmembrane protein 41B [Mortierella sp. AM989]